MKECIRLPLIIYDDDHCWKWSKIAIQCVYFMMTKWFDPFKQHAGSDGELLGNKDSANPLPAVSSLSSSMSEPESERHDNEDELADSKDSLNLLTASDSEEVARGTELALGAVEPEEELMIEGDQVADFASSLLAAISCWHYRARALLSAKFSTVSASISVFLPLPVFRLREGNAVAARSAILNRLQVTTPLTS